MKHFVEIRSYNLKDGTRTEFHCLFMKQAIIALIGNYTEIVLELDEATVQGLRK